MTREELEKKLNGFGYLSWLIAEDITEEEWNEVRQRREELKAEILELARR